jgi:urease accessory protein
MIRATRIIAKGQWSKAAADSVVLDYDQRHRRRMAMEGTGGLAFLLDLADAVPLRDGDGLELEDGRIVSVTATPEPLAEITAANAADLMRIAWHLGNRHLPAELRPDRIRIRRDHVIEDMVRGLGAHVTLLDAPFDPESGAYHSDSDHRHDAHHHHNPALDHDDRLDDD